MPAACCFATQQTGMCDGQCTRSILAAFHCDYLASDLTQLKESAASTKTSVERLKEEVNKLAQGQHLNTKMIGEQGHALDQHQEEIQAQKAATTELKITLQQQILRQKTNMVNTKRIKSLLERN